jgi:endogenous inhibitor of DNA gyrase (YacG/DUF329 family)
MDLGNWAADKYVIPSPIQPEPQDEDPGEQRGADPHKR